MIADNGNSSPNGDNINLLCVISSALAKGKQTFKGSKQRKAHKLTCRWCVAQDDIIFDKTTYCLQISTINKILFVYYIFVEDVCLEKRWWEGENVYYSSQSVVPFN
uniref:Uncharacterized protein n=1 Tax=Glossina palpalis gambiensis TaxID=67801 RepID=A0A1B0B3U6_9MUSC